MYKEKKKYMVQKIIYLYAKCLHICMYVKHIHIQYCHIYCCFTHRINLAFYPHIWVPPVVLMSSINRCCCCCCCCGPICCFTYVVCAMQAAHVSEFRFKYIYKYIILYPHHIYVCMYLNIWHRPYQVNETQRICFRVDKLICNLWTLDYFSYDLEVSKDFQNYLI